MKWSVQQLNKLRNKGIDIDEMVDVSELKLVSRDIQNVSLVHVKGVAIFGKHSVTFSLQIEGEMVLTCSRTLADVPFPFQIATAETFKFHGWVGFGDDEEVHDLENDTVNLVPYINQAILLEIPIQIFSDGLDGEAPPKGKDWQLVTEIPKKEQFDPRLADLAKFFDDK
jgi:uncharacterized protein